MGGGGAWRIERQDLKWRGGAWRMSRRDLKRRGGEAYVRSGTDDGGGAGRGDPGGGWGLEDGKVGRAAAGRNRVLSGVDDAGAGAARRGAGSK